MEALQHFSVVAFILALLGAAMWALKRRGLAHFQFALSRPRVGRQLEVIERLQLTPQHALCLVRVENRTLLIGTAPSSCSVLERDEQ